MKLLSGPKFVQMPHSSKFVWRIFSFVINECCRIKQSHSLVFGAAVGWFACMHQTTLWNFSFYAICVRNLPCTFGLLHVKIKTHAFFFTVFTLQLYITHPGKAHTPHPREGLLVHNMHFPQLQLDKVAFSLQVFLIEGARRPILSGKNGSSRLLESQSAHIIRFALPARRASHVIRPFFIFDVNKG